MQEGKLLNEKKTLLLKGKCLPMYLTALTKTNTFILTIMILLYSIMLFITATAGRPLLQLKM